MSCRYAQISLEAFINVSLNTQIQNISEVPHGVVHLAQLSVDLIHARIDSCQGRDVEEFLEVGNHGLQGVSSGTPQNLRNVVKIIS